MAMDIPDSDDVRFRISQMQSGIENISTISQTVASRDYSYHEISCRKGDEIALLDSEIVSVGSDYAKTIIDTMAVIDDIEDKETCVLFRGKGVPEEREEELYEHLSARYPMMESEFINGGQEIYHWIIGLALYRKSESYSCHCEARSHSFGVVPQSGRLRQSPCHSFCFQ